VAGRSHTYPMAVPLVLPARFSLGPPWAVPAVEVLLLVAIIAVDRGRIDRRSAAARALSLVLVAVLVADAAGVTGPMGGCRYITPNG
jgi:hypothetical protein